MNEERVERRLAAILAADVAGYSRLMGADEEGTLAALKAIRRELGYPKIAARLEKHQVSKDEVEVFLEKITQAAHLTPGILQVDAVQDDTADNEILACALEGEADFIISGDHHLTDLKSFQGIRIVDPATFLGFFERK